jgi:hypothetical protein
MAVSVLSVDAWDETACRRCSRCGRVDLGEIPTASAVREIAEELGPRLDLAALEPGGTMFRLSLVPRVDALTLDVTPHLLSVTARQRLTQVLHAGGLGPDPHVFHLIRDDSDHVNKIAEQWPDVLYEAHDYQLVTYEHDDINQQVNVRITPRVQYSLGHPPATRYGSRPRSKH